MTLLEKGAARAKDSGAFGVDGHPWATEIADAFISYRSLRQRDANTTEWLDDFKARTLYWCAQVLAGAPPFPPKPRPRLDDAETLLARQGPTTFDASGSDTYIEKIQPVLYTEGLPV